VFSAAGSFLENNSADLIRQGSLSPSQSLPTSPGKARLLWQEAHQKFKAHHHYDHLADVVPPVMGVAHAVEKLRALADRAWSRTSQAKATEAAEASAALLQRAKHQQAVASELLATEQIYVSKLDALVHRWRAPLAAWAREQVGHASQHAAAAGLEVRRSSNGNSGSLLASLKSSHHHSSSSSSNANGNGNRARCMAMTEPPVTAAEIAIVFSNVEELLAQSKPLLATLASAIKSGWSSSLQPYSQPSSQPPSVPCSKWDSESPLKGTCADSSGAAAAVDDSCQRIGAAFSTCASLMDAYAHYLINAEASANMADAVRDRDKNMILSFKDPPLLLQTCSTSILIAFKIVA
jgi:hypothetical protein